MGSSGSGKSTLLNIIGILDGYDQGQYILDNRLIADLSEAESASTEMNSLDLYFNPPTSSPTKQPLKM